MKIERGRRPAPSRVARRPGSARRHSSTKQATREQQQREAEERVLLGRVRGQRRCPARPTPASDRRGNAPYAAMSSEWITRVEAGAVEPLRPDEVQPERVRQQHPGDHRGDPEPAQEVGQRRPRLGPGGRVQRPDGEEHAERERGEEQPLGGDGEGDRDQHAEDHAVAQPVPGPAQREHPPDQQRHQPAGGPVQVGVGVRDHAGGEADEQAADPGGQPAADQMPGEQPVPGQRGGGEVEGEDHQEGGRRPDQVRQRGEDHRVHGDRGVDREVDPVRDVDQVREERVRPVGERVPAEGQQPLEERLVAGVDRDGAAGSGPATARWSPRRRARAPPARRAGRPGGRGRRAGARGGRGGQGRGGRHAADVTNRTWTRPVRHGTDGRPVNAVALYKGPRLTAQPGRTCRPT